LNSICTKTHSLNFFLLDDFFSSFQPRRFQSSVFDADPFDHPFFNSIHDPFFPTSRLGGLRSSILGSYARDFENDIDRIRNATRHNDRLTGNDKDPFKLRGSTSQEVNLPTTGADIRRQSSRSSRAKAKDSFTRNVENPSTFTSSSSSTTSTSSPSSPSAASSSFASGRASSTANRRGNRSTYHTATPFEYYNEFGQGPYDDVTHSSSMNMNSSRSNQHRGSPSQMYTNSGVWGQTDFSGRSFDGNRRAGRQGSSMSSGSSSSSSQSNGSGWRRIPIT